MSQVETLVEKGIDTQVENGAIPQSSRNEAVAEELSNYYKHIALADADDITKAEDSDGARANGEAAMAMFYNTYADEHDLPMMDIAAGAERDEDFSVEPYKKKPMDFH